MNVIDEIKKRLREKIELLEEMKRTAASSGIDALSYHLVAEGLRMALRIVEEVEAESSS